jgi:UDPglucose 6-dehydrogenase
MAATNADAVIIMTEWPQFADLDWPFLIQHMRLPLVLDGRNLLSDDVITQILDVNGAIYIPVGRPIDDRSSSWARVSSH